MMCIFVCACFKNPRNGFQKKTNFIKKLGNNRREISPPRVTPSQFLLLFLQGFPLSQ